MSRWITIYPYMGREQFEPRPAAYAFFVLEEGLIYIGETTNMQKRMKQHALRIARYSCGYFSALWGYVADMMIKVKYSERFGEEAMAERRLIRRLRPKFNRRGLTIVVAAEFSK